MYWFWGVTDRVESEMYDRDIHCDFANKDFWGWFVCGSYFLLVGSFVYHYKLSKAMNLLCHDYNEKAEQEHRELLKRR